MMTSPTKPDPLWTLGEVLDLEIRTVNGAALQTAAQDRAPLVAKFGPALAEVPRPALFHAWLPLQREHDTTLPGRTLDRIFRVGRGVAWIVGGLVGASAAGGYLAYFGREPVNPFWFLLWLVVVPLVVTMALVGLARAWHDWSGPGAVARWLMGALCRRMSGSARQAWQAWVREAERQRARHGELATLPLLGLTQRAACGFALGAALALGARVVFTDLIFGWQSSVNWGAETWHTIARAMSSPWAWLFPAGCPTLDEVRLSHFTYVGGVAAIDPAAGRAWWPFLLGSLLVWGALVRGLFILWLGAKERVARQALDWNRSAINALHRALTGPMFESSNPSRLGPVEVATRVAPPHAGGRGWLVLTERPEEDGVGARAAVAGAVQGEVAAVQAVTIDDPGANATVLEQVAASPSPVAIVLPAARDPIVAIKKTLAAIASAAAGRECVVLLRGNAERVALWRKFAAAHRLEMEFIAAP